MSSPSKVGRDLSYYFKFLTNEKSQKKKKANATTTVSKYMTERSNPNKVKMLIKRVLPKNISSSLYQSRRIPQEYLLVL